MSILLFVFYSVLCSWLLTRSRFMKSTGIDPKLLVLLFLLRVAAGAANAWISYKLSPVADTFIFHQEGMIEYRLLFSNPSDYFTNIFHNGYGTGYGAVFSSNMSYWNDLTSNLVIKFLSVCDLFSFGHYYVNVILYNFLIFFGCVAVYKVFSSVYTDNKRLLIVACFLLPSFLFYSSVIHKEGLIYPAVGMLVYHLHRACSKRHFSFKQIIYIILLSAFIFLQRNYVLLALIPAMLAYVITTVKKTNPWFSFAVVYAVAVFAFFGAVKIHPALDLPQQVANKQQDFSHLPMAKTTVVMDSLQPSLNGFVRNAPQAINHAFLRPYVTEINRSILILPLSLELLFYEVLIFLVLIFHKPNQPINPFTLFSIGLAFSVLLLIGYIVPIIGSVVRYRSIFLPFLLVPIICNIQWVRLRQLFKLKNN